MEQETIDLYQEHSLHDSYEEKCSECFKENRLIKAKNLVNEKKICYWCGNTGMTPNDDESLGGADWFPCENHDYRNGRLSVNAEEALAKFPVIE